MKTDRARAVLIIAFEDGRWGPARLPKPLSAAGFRVAALCPADNAVAQTGFIERHFPLGNVKSSRHFETRLARAMRDWQPDLVIPADERVVACLHYLVRRARAGQRVRLNRDAMAIIIASLGDPDQFDAMLLKDRTLSVARQAGVRVPGGGPVASPADACAQASQIGFPVYVKQAFSWAGRGVIRCDDAAAVVDAMAAARPAARSLLRDRAKRLLHRDWYPTTSSTDIQQAIDGTPAMYCAVAVAGKLVAGFAGVTRQATSANGPSSVVWIGPDNEMEAAAAKMIAALGATGFIGFDFMIEAATGHAYLLECNPRPIQVSHLGARIGIDLCAALAAELSGEQNPQPRSVTSETVALFPQEWQRDPAALAQCTEFRDAPLDDPRLMRFMVNSAYRDASLGLAA